MSFFKNITNMKNEENNKEKNKVGLVIHITPIAIYLYISKTGRISSYIQGSGLYMEDDKGNYIEIAGDYISLELNHYSEIEVVIERYGLYNVHLPIIRINARES